jgi:hypothetical protein
VISLLIIKMKTAIPKMLNLNAPCVRNQRTLVWLQNQSTSVNWAKWDAIVTSFSAYKYWSERNARIVGIALLDFTGDIDNFMTELFEIHKKMSVVLISDKIMSLKSQEFWSANFDNVMNLDTILDIYPFVEIPWDGTEGDAAAIFGLLCRYNRLVDCPVSNQRREMLSDLITSMNDIQPNQVWLVTQFFQPTNNRRFKEIKECLRQNCLCPYIDKIVLLNEQDLLAEFNPLEESTKIQQVVLGRRLTYADFLKYVHDEVPNGVFAILANADIYFGDSLLELWKINIADKMLGLLRWDVDKNGEAKIFGPRSDSQDSWIFLSDSVKSRNWDYSKFQFQLGQAGCDNAFAGQILRNRFVLLDPALNFKTYHLHNTNIRSYNVNDYIQSDIYVNVAPTYIIDIKQEITPPQAPKMISNELASFEVKSSSMSNEITYCTMLEKDGRYKWEPSVENHYFQAAIPVYKWNKACVTPNGLVYDLHNIYVGKHNNDSKFQFWSNTNVDIFTPLQKVDKMFAIPFKNTNIFKHPDLYILNYLSRCLRLLKDYPKTAFWIPKPFMDYLHFFNWGDQKLSVVIFDERRCCLANEVIGFLPGPESSELGIEDIQVLRSLHPGWIQKPTGKVCAIVIGQEITQEFVESEIRPLLQSMDEEWSIRFVYESEYASYDTLLGISLCIFLGGQNTQRSFAKLWALPKDCCVVEFQQELKIDGEFQHLAHIAGFKSWVLLLSKGTQKDIQDQMITQLTKWFNKNQEELVI